MMTSKQRAYLRGLANKLDPIFQIGKMGISENLINQLSDALEARELIKITVLETAPDTTKNLAIEISEKTNSILVQTIGNKITLFRQKKENSRYELPK
ncbi:MAG: ribosome assembly RNA-binding protein YhbY [Clostridia bacterium]|nr:ribosome assembly RNA-binding protein YhbY [Clostridia bacterium]